MKTTHPAFRALALSIAVLSTWGSSCRQTTSEKADLARLEQMEQDLRVFIAAAPCSDSTDCAVVAVGAKPCGGPWGYLVYSTASVDSTELGRKARAYTDFNRLLNERWGYVSDCAVQPVPQPSCVDGRCVDLLELYDQGIAP